LIKLNLSQYNTSEHPGLNKFFAAVLYLLEYVIVLPFIVFLWFAGLSFILYLISDQQDVQQVLMITTAVVIAVRLLAYQGGPVAKDLAKLFPFTALSLFLLTDVGLSVESVLVQVGALRGLVTPLLSFLAVIVVVELLLRILTTLADLVRGRSEGEDPRG
jgi:amino acid transporter